MYKTERDRNVEPKNKRFSFPWRGNLTALLGLVAMLLPTQGVADVISTVDSLLTLYQKAPTKEKYEKGRQLMDIYEQYDAFHEEPPRYVPTLPADSLNLAVWFATECFYYNYAYFAECIDYCRRALPLAKDHHPHIYATLLCDLGYSLHKTGQSPEAIKTERRAVEASQKAGNLLQLSRAYLYLAIVNLNTEQYDDAKWFVEKAIETNDQLGINGNTHNTLGIACDVYGQAGDTRRAIAFGKRAVEAARAIGFDEGVANHLSQLSYCYNRCDSFELGAKTAQQAIDIVEAMPTPDRNLLALCIGYKAYNLVDLKHYEEAAALLRRSAAINEEVGNVREACADMNELYKALLHVDSTQAMAALQRYTQLHDSIFHADLSHELSQANAQLHNDELQDQNSIKSRQIMLLLGGISLLLIVVGGLIFHARRKSASNKRQHSLIIELLGQLEKYRDASPTEEAGAEGEENTYHNEANIQFLNQVNQTILRLMPLGQADIDHVSSALCMTPSKFRRRMQECTELTPANYILTIRMDEAKRMLSAYPQHTVGEVAYHCGFADQSHFSRTFNRLFSITPMQFIKGTGKSLTSAK